MTFHPDNPQRVLAKSEQQKQNVANQLSFLGERYRDITMLGSGGMGKLYRAFDSVLNKPVAIKVLSSRQPDNKMVLRFQQEAKMASRLQHTNIVNVLDFGAGSEQELYLIMDLVEGETLQDFIEKEGPLPLACAVPLIAQMCDALTHAHNKGVVHRDIKPSNIMIAGDKQTGLSLRIVDFGLAILQSRDVRITQTGDTIGTPLYISPEQIKGEEIDFRADIYSLGCVIFTMLSGHPPYRGEKALDTFQKHLNAQIPSLAESGVEVENLEELDSILERLLAKVPADRYQNLGELKEELAAFLPTEAVFVKTMDDASFDLRIPFAVSTRVPKWSVAAIVLLVIGVPLLVMSYAANKPIAQVPQVNELKLEQASLFSTPKEQDASPNLETINLTFMPITKVGLQHLKAAKKLICLTIANNDLTDEDLRPILGMKNLRLIDLSKCKGVTDQTVKALSKNRALEKLRVIECPLISAKALDKLHQAYPKLVIDRTRFTDKKKLDNFTKIFCTGDDNKLPDLEL